MSDWAQFLRSGGMGQHALEIAPGERAPRELIDYYNRISQTSDPGVSIPAYSGTHYSLANLSVHKPRDAKTSSVYIPGARQTYGAGYRATLAAAGEQRASGNGPAALEWPVPFGSRDKAVEGYTGHVPCADAMIGLTTAERVRLSDRKLAEAGSAFRPRRDPRYEPAAQPHAGFPYTREQSGGLAAQRLRLVEGQEAGVERAAEQLRGAVSIVAPRPATAGPAAARIRARGVMQYVFEEGPGGEFLPPRGVVRPTFVTAHAPEPKVWGAPAAGQARAQTPAGASVRGGAPSALQLDSSHQQQQWAASTASSWGVQSVAYALTSSPSPAKA